MYLGAEQLGADWTWRGKSAQGDVFAGTPAPHPQTRWGWQWRLQAGPRRWRAEGRRALAHARRGWPSGPRTGRARPGRRHPHGRAARNLCPAVLSCSSRGSRSSAWAGGPGRGGPAPPSRQVRRPADARPPGPPRRDTRGRQRRPEAGAAPGRRAGPRRGG